MAFGWYGHFGGKEKSLACAGDGTVITQFSSPVHACYLELSLHVV